MVATKKLPVGLHRGALLAARCADWAKRNAAERLDRPSNYARLQTEYTRVKISYEDTIQLAFSIASFCFILLVSEQGDPTPHPICIQFSMK